MGQQQTPLKSRFNYVHRFSAIEITLLKKEKSFSPSFSFLKKDLRNYVADDTMYSFLASVSRVPFLNFDDAQI